MSIKINELSRDLTKALREYTTDVVEEIDMSAAEVAKDTVDLLKTTSPLRTGDYAKGWRVKKGKGSVVVHNATNYQLTHLIENGHATRNGGRVSGRVHIKPAEELAIKEFTKRAEKAVSG